MWYARTTHNDVYSINCDEDNTYSITIHGTRIQNNMEIIIDINQLTEFVEQVGYRLEYTNNLIATSEVMTDNEKELSS